MASADAKGTSTVYKFGPRLTMEAFEARVLMAVNPVGAPGVIAASGVTAVESAFASPDSTNNFRYASYLSGTTSASVVTVSGPDSSNPGTPVALTVPANSTISNTDVAANSPMDFFVVVYQVTTTTTTGGGPGGGTTTVDSNIYGQIFANGQAVGSAFLVNTTLAGNQTDCRVGMDGSGKFVVVWQNETSGNALVARRFNTDGTAATAEFTVNATGVEPDISVNNSGAFVIVYDSGTTTFAQLYGTSGGANGAPISINSQAFTEPAVALATNGRFIVSYATGSGTARTVVARRYQNDGTPIGGVFTVSTTTGVAQTAPEIAVDTSGGFVIGWAQATTGTNYDSLAFRPFRNSGVATAAETVVSGVRFGVDRRFGLANRIPGLIHVAYASTAGEALMQTYQDTATTGGGTNVELAVPTGALLIDLSADLAGAILDVAQVGNTLTVTINGTATNYTKSNYTSIYVRGGTGDDTIDLNSDVTLPAIIFGRAGSDIINGSAANDTIDGGDGREIDTDGDGIGDKDLGNQIQARGGDDVVYGGAGDDTLYGDTGNDRLLGGPGLNFVYGEDGNDTVVGGTRRDALYGANGNDSITAGDGGDLLDGGNGNDTLEGESGTDRLLGENGNDYLEGGDGPDTLHGNRGDDRLFGNAGRDTLFGDAGQDYLRGGGAPARQFGFPSSIPIRDDTNTFQLDVVYYDGSDDVNGRAFLILTK